MARRTGQANALDNRLIGNGAANALSGLAGNDYLDGAAGADNLTGGTGNDTYVVDQSGDSVTELAGEGTDTVQSGISYVLGSNAENLILTSTGNLSGDGNGLDNSLVGNAGNNLLRGFDGNDTLNGGAGGDTVNGGAGVDTADYGTAASAATVELWTGMASQDGHGSADTLSAIENIAGTLFNDLLAGNESSNSLSGNNGNDQLYGGGGNDALLGEAGDDHLRGDGGNDTLDGGSGVDTADYSIAAGAVTVEIWRGTAAVDGDGGADTLIGIENVFGSLYNDLLVGSEDANSLFGNVGNDQVFGGGVADALAGEAGDDMLRGGGGNDTLDGGAGIDTADYSTAAGAVTVEIWRGTAAVDGDGGSDTLIGIENVFGSLYNDLLVGSEEANSLFGNAGNDTVVGGGLADALKGEGGDDVLRGGGGNDTLDGGAGIDIADYSTAASAVTVEIWRGTAGVDGDGGADVLIGIENVFGSLYNDLLVGSEDANSLFGNVGNDQVFGGGVADALAGEAGDDMLRGGGGNDTLDGGAGIDTADYSTAASAVTVEIWRGTAAVDGDGGSDTLIGVENVFGSASNDFVVGDESANSLYGGDGSDLVLGGGGADTLVGEAGNDTLAAGTGSDVLTGGIGQDRFRFDTSPNASNADWINDFVSGTDKLELDDAAYAAIGALGNFAAGDGRFWAAAGAVSGHDATDRLIYNTSTGGLYYDADGSGAGAAQLVATLQTKPSIAATDIAAI